MYQLWLFYSLNIKILTFYFIEFENLLVQGGELSGILPLTVELNAAKNSLNDMFEEISP